MGWLRGESGKMKLELRHGIPFTEVILRNNGKEIASRNVVVDTGSASTIISAEIAVQLDMESGLNDSLNRVRGVGGTEFVYEKVIGCIEIGGITLENFKLQVGAMNYGFEIDALLGMDFLQACQLLVDCYKMEVRMAR